MLEVVEPGLLTTIQDAGRPEAVDLGVPSGGACDPWSLAVANALLGNEATEPAVEMTLAGPTFTVRRDCAVALAGADLEARLVEREHRLEPGRSHLLRAGQTLSFGAARDGTGIRGYLALAGGVAVPRVLGSASTCLVGGFGGLEGRPLRAGDVLVPADGRPRLQRGWPGGGAGAAVSNRLRVVAGPDVERLGQRLLERFVAAHYEVSPHSDRQGIRLDGPPLDVPPGSGSMLSQGVVWGSIQITPDGRAICLLADHQTVGGYPVLAVVVTADRPALGQLGPGDGVSFEVVSSDEARRLLLRQADAFRAGVRALEQAGG